MEQWNYVIQEYTDELSWNEHSCVKPGNVEVCMVDVHEDVIDVCKYENMVAGGNMTYGCAQQQNGALCTRESVWHKGGDGTCGQRKLLRVSWRCDISLPRSTSTVCH